MVQIKDVYLKLSEDQIQKKVRFIENYTGSANAATASLFDANANVSSKNVATLEAELNKDINIQVNREIVSNKIRELFGDDLAKEYIRQIEAHELYAHDESSLKPYCLAISMYPFLLNGLKDLGGESRMPKHLSSFCGSFVNLIFAISSQFAGAVAAVEFLLCFDYYARKDYGENYLKTNKSEIENHLQHVVYALNQPAAARGFQSVFFNVSIFDYFYFKSMFENFVFPDLTKPSWNSMKELQAFFMSWFNKERSKAILTFPVVTAAMLIKDKEPLDTEFSNMCAKELSEGNSFFIYQSESADSLSSCCRLRSEITENVFSYTLGAGGVSTGSINVITINMNRLIQDGRDLREQVQKIHKYQVAFRKLMEGYKGARLLPVYDAGFISLDKQFLTIGINGMVEAAEYLGIDITDNPTYKQFVCDNLKIIYEENKKAKQEYGYMFNTEFVPAENLGIKNASWDRSDRYVVNRDCYNSYFYRAEDENLNIVDKFMLHGKEYIQYLDGGSALHLNLEQKTTKSGFLKLIKLAAKTGCNYFCFNVKLTICNDCDYLDKATRTECKKCGSKNVDYATRVIGYLKRISNFSKDRQKEHALRIYHK